MKPDRWFQRWLRLLPLDFRSDYGADIEQVFRDQRREAARRGRPALVRVWAKNIVGLLAIGPREHAAQLRQDVRYALRGLRRTPGFTAVAMLTLALGIGANTAIFSIVHEVLLAPLPYGAPDDLVSVTNDWGGAEGAALSNPEYMDYAEQSRTLDIAATAQLAVNITGGAGDPERIGAGVVTVNTLEVLGVRPAVGRSFRAEEESDGRDNVVLLSYRLWQRRFAGDPGAVGQTISIDGVPHDVIGVLPADFLLPLDFGAERRVDMLIPLTLDRAAPRNRRGGHFLVSVARLRAGATLQAARADMEAVVSRLVALYPEEHDQGPYFRLALTPLRQNLLGDARPVLYLLASAVCLVLLIACANVASLLLARSEARRRELAVRSALGASRFRVARQLMTEAFVLSVAGAAAGLLVALWLQQLVVTIDGATLPRIDRVRLSIPVLACAGVTGIAAGVIFGLIPAFQSARARIDDALRLGVRGTGTAARRTLVVVQVSLAVVLLVAAGLLTKSFARVVSVPSGLNPAGVLTLRVSLPPSRYPSRPELTAYFSRLLGRLRVLPGVAAAGAASGLPLAIASGDWGFDIEGRPQVNGRRPGAADWYVVTGGYFEALDIGLARGRLPADSDHGGAPPVVFLNETAARKFFPEQDPVGKRVRLSSTTGGEQPWRTIAGIVGDVRTLGLDQETRTEIYIPYDQFQHFAAGVQARAMTIVLKTASGNPLGLSGAVREELHAIDPEIAVAQLRDMTTVLSGSVADRRLNMILVGAFGLLALVLASIGLYGVMAFQVVRRTREVGVRLALGASRSEVLMLVIGQGMRLVASGLVIGLVLAALVTSAMSGLLFGVSTRDVAVFLSVPLLLILIGLMACYLPARRAMAVDPAIALRAE
jgi:putative ABC transport system permease protein